jgi:hypothetical protein
MGLWATVQQIVTVALLGTTLGLGKNRIDLVLYTYPWGAAATVSEAEGTVALRGGLYSAKILSALALGGNKAPAPRRSSQSASFGEAGMSCHVVLEGVPHLAALSTVSSGRPSVCGVVAATNRAPVPGAFMTAAHPLYAHKESR